jgi:hypothetical protein
MEDDSIECGKKPDLHGLRRFQRRDTLPWPICFCASLSTIGLPFFQNTWKILTLFPWVFCHFSFANTCIDAEHMSRAYMYTTKTENS